MYEDDWITAMRPWWFVVARSEDVPAGDVVRAELLREVVTLRRTEAGAVESVAGTARVAERHGFVWACLVAEGEERAGIPEIAESGAGTHRFWTGWVFDTPAQALRHVENSCDVAHFAVLHTDSFGHESGIPVEPTRVTAHDGGTLSFRFDTPVCDPTIPPHPDRPTVPGSFDYDVTIPCTIRLGGASGPGTVMFIHYTPLDVYRTRVFWGCFFRNDLEVDEDAYVATEKAIKAADQPIVFSQRPRGLPLEPRAELHLPHDRFAVAYRRALAATGVPSGAVPLTRAS
jgi:vanillate O-demethylase monooxygenase subunit